MRNDMMGDLRENAVNGARRFRWAVLCCAAVLGPWLVVLAGCRPAPQTQAPPPPKSTEVIVSLPTTSEITDFEDFTGRTVAIKTVEMRARVTGYLETISFKEGGYVERGAVLFTIDPRAYEAEVKRTEANLLQAQAKLKRLELDYRRAATLVETRAITREQFDQVSGDRAQAAAAIDVAKADVELARLNLDFTKVRAPIAGRISRTQLDVGNLIRADDTVLTTIVTTDPIYAYFDVDERTLLRIRRYTEAGRIKPAQAHRVSVLVGLADEDGYPHQGAVNFVDNQLDPSTGTLQVRGQLPNPDNLLAPGLFVRVRLPIGQPYRALLVPEQAIGSDQGQKFVYVVSPQNKAMYRRVQVGKQQGSQRVVLKGLSEGEPVVVSGLQRVRPGAEVQPKMETQTAETAPSSTPGVAQATPPEGRSALGR